MDTQQLPRVWRSARARQHGFTLVELMVAMTGGLFLSIVVFALSRDATRFYQSETRVASATLAGVNGFERLFSDISRAGHLTTPNVDSDPRVCNRPDDNWPALIRQLRAVRIETDTSATTDGTEIETAGIQPMSITLAGALDVTEELTTTHVGPDGAGAFFVVVREDSAAAARMGIVPGAANANNNLAILQAAFAPGGTGRAVRITQLDGMEQYGVVRDVVNAPSLRIRLQAAPGLVFRSAAAGALQCGFRGFNTGATINVVNFVRYQLRSMSKDAAYKSLFDAVKDAPFESGRVELVREELTPDGVAAIPGTTELVAEYAVDLRFSLLRANLPTDPALVAATPADIDGTYGSTQLLRSIRARLSVRSREADRYGPVADAPAGDLYRIALAGGGTGNTPYARVRTFQADIPLRNLEGANWP